MRSLSPLLSLTLFTSFAPALAVESSTRITFEKKGPVWYHENEPFSDCRKVRRSTLCKGITSQARPDKIGSFSINTLSSLATFKNRNAQVLNIDELGQNVVKALEYARTLSNLTSASAMNAHFNKNPNDEYELLKYAYWLEWKHFKEFAAEVDRELNFESLALVLDMIENDADDFAIPIPTSFCSKRDLFFLISLKSATDLEDRLSNFDVQQQFEVFKCANYTMWIHFETFIREHKFIVDYHPDPILSMLLSSDGPEAISTTTQLKDSTIKYRGIKEFIAKQNLNTIDKIAGLYHNNEDLMLKLFPLISGEFVINLGTCTKKLVSSICIVHHGESLCNKALVMLVKETNCHFKITITDCRYLRRVLGPYFLKFLRQSQIKVIPKSDVDLNNFFDCALTSTVPIIIDKFIEPMIILGEPLLKYIRLGNDNLSNFLKVIRIKNLSIWEHELYNIATKQIEILSVVNTISVKAEADRLVSDKFQRSLREIKKRYPQITVKLGWFRIYEEFNENWMNKLVESLRLFDDIKTVAIGASFYCEKEAKVSIQMLKGLVQVHPKIDLLTISTALFKSHKVPSEFFHALPEFKRLKLNVNSHTGPNLNLFLGRVALKLTQLEIAFLDGFESISNDMPNLWPLVTDLTVYNDMSFYDHTGFYKDISLYDHIGLHSKICKVRATVTTNLRMPSLRTVTVVRDFGSWSDRRIMTKEEYLSIQY